MIRATDAYEEGYEDFDSNEPINNPYSDEDKRSYYYNCGWFDASNEYEEERALASKPDCPICGHKMDELMSGNFCTNDECQYHTHIEVSL